MIIRITLLLAAGLMLGSCCLSGNCYAPVAGVAGTAGVVAPTPDGLAAVPVDEDEPQAVDSAPKPRKTAQRKRDFEPMGETSSAARYRGDKYEEQMAADKADEDRLKRKLIICQNCSSSGH